MPSDRTEPPTDSADDSRENAIAQGYAIDDTCYPWIAYRGPRFAPTEWHAIITPGWPDGVE